MDALCTREKEKRTQSINNNNNIISAIVTEHYVRVIIIIIMENSKQYGRPSAANILCTYRCIYRGIAVLTRVEA